MKRQDMVIWGSVAGAIVGMVSAWNLVAVPFLNSDLSPIVGAQRYAIDLKTQKSVVETLDKTAETLARTNQSLEATIRRQDRNECASANRRLASYSDMLKNNPRDENARELRRIALREIGVIPGCMQESQGP